MSFPLRPARIPQNAVCTIPTVILRVVVCLVCVWSGLMYCCCYSAPDRGAEYCDDRVCLSVCVFVCPRASLEIHVRSLPNFVHVTCSRGSVFLWRRCDTLCTSGFMDDVILALKPRQLNVFARLVEAQPTCSLWHGYKRRVGILVAGHWTHAHRPTFRAPRSGPTRPQ